VNEPDCPADDSVVPEALVDDSVLLLVVLLPVVLLVVLAELLALCEPEVDDPGKLRDIPTCRHRALLAAIAVARSMTEQEL